MKGTIRVFAGLVIVLFLAKSSFCSVILSEDFESLTDGDTYGEITNIYDLGNHNIPIAGGKVVENNGNKMVELNGTYPNFTADLGIPIDIAHHADINEVNFDFYFDYNTATQTGLFAPTTLQVDLYLMKSGKLTSQKTLLNFNFNGIQSASMDIAPDPASYASPFNEHFSITNLAGYLADITTLNPSFPGFDAAFLIFSVVYLAEGDGLNDGDPYETKAYIDELQISDPETTPIPEPAAWASFIFGIVLLRRVAIKLIK